VSRRASSGRKVDGPADARRIVRIRLYTNDQQYLATILDSLAAEGDIAYVTVLDVNGRPVAERRFAENTGRRLAAAAPRRQGLPALGGMTATDRAITAAGTSSCCVGWRQSHDS